MQVSGLHAAPIKVETDITFGLHTFQIVGLPDKGVEESRDRVSAALKNTGFASPKTQNHKITVSLAPADIRKEGPVFDVPIALAYLKSTKELDVDLDKKVFVGELSLKGDVERVKGALILAQGAKASGAKEIYLPKSNAKEAALVEGIDVYGVSTLRELVDHLLGAHTMTPTPVTQIEYKQNEKSFVDFEDVKGQEAVKRALVIAAAGGHNICMYGPPGTGKTMLAKAFTYILPHLSREEIFEVTGIHSVSSNIAELITMPPLRAPHHTASHVSLVGGGAVPKPGEITLAHRGVLFMDEFPEFEKESLEALREPLEEGKVTISRARGTISYPAKFIMVAAMNPCPCGNYGNKDKQCICKSSDIERYERKISGPIMDRIDMWVQVSNIAYKDLSNKIAGTSTSMAKSLVESSRAIIRNRFASNTKLNRDMNAKDLEKYAHLTDEVRSTLDTLAKQLSLSPRSYHRVHRLARTIADLDNSENINVNHIIEAFQYRPKIGQR